MQSSIVAPVSCLIAFYSYCNILYYTIASAGLQPLLSMYTKFIEFVNPSGTMLHEGIIVSEYIIHFYHVFRLNQAHYYSELCLHLFFLLCLH